MTLALKRVWLSKDKIRIFNYIDSKESACSAGDLSSIPRSGRSPWRWGWQPTPVFLPGESHGQRSLVSYSPWRCKRVRHDWVTNTFSFHWEKCDVTWWKNRLSAGGREKRKMTLLGEEGNISTTWWRLRSIYSKERKEKHFCGGGKQVLRTMVQR